MTDLSDLPSRKNEEAVEAKRKYAALDKDINVWRALRGWEAKKVRAFLTCYHCHKQRCIYSKTKEDWNDNCVTVQQKLESVGHRYSCGDHLFGDGPLSEVCVHMFSFVTFLFSPFSHSTNISPDCNSKTELDL